MEREELTRRWPEIRPRIKANWNRLADDELERAKESPDLLIRLIAERYEESPQAIKMELDRMIRATGAAHS